MTDGYVSRISETSGDKIETEEIQVLDETTATWVTVQRQRAAIPDPVTLKGDTLDALLVELKLISYLLATGLNINDNLDQLRNEFYETV